MCVYLSLSIGNLSQRIGRFTYIFFNYNKSMKRKRNKILISILCLMALSVFFSSGSSQEASKSKKELKDPLSKMNSLKDKTFRLQTSFSLDPDAHKIHLVVLDNFSGKVGTTHQEISFTITLGFQLTISILRL